MSKRGPELRSVIADPTSSIPFPRVFRRQKDYDGTGDFPIITFPFSAGPAPHSIPPYPRNRMGVAYRVAYFTLFLLN
jgi:hypothetical protein